ncbi:MAG: hypothetical protein FRX48_00903 [Lasallia pustulata]|uniref:Pal1 cell morphology n=1 Tax=Lasallia pustulata TaxID=136370 RepID=A0A5M8Q4S6_9LECA|nr:MAG: hypothetical protein FRX48_00903 [Lasallia pustulata]
METTSDKHWASKYLLDPLNAPEPSEETGPGTHYPSTFSSNSNNPYPSPPMSDDPEKKHSVHVRKTAGSRDEYPSPPASASASPRHDRSIHRRELLERQGISSQRQSVDSTEIPTSTNGRARTSSLFSRYPGDKSHRPLDAIKRETKIANRAPHLRNSPVEAVAASNKEALKATPREKILDSIRKHRPLDGVAMVPPGIADREGRVYNYEEGANLMIEEGGNYKRWPGVTYLPDDVKGKGEPSYSIEKALKEHKNNRHMISEGGSGIEMASRPRSSTAGADLPRGEGQSYSEWQSDVRRSNTTGRSPSGGLRKRLGSLGRNKSSQ